MHFEILIEDMSGRRALEVLVPKIIGDGPHTCRVFSYKGVGKIPKDQKVALGVRHKQLLNDLPRRLQGYGKTFPADSDHHSTAVVVVCDLDKKDKQTFLDELSSILQDCSPKPLTRFCLAIEEGEAWFLGDADAILAAYPLAKQSVLENYVQDSICGTWETLADAIYTGGHSALVEKGWQAVGAEKFRWAENITPNMDVGRNKSPSFAYFREQLMSLAGLADSAGPVGKV